jgi:hypothetical protein
MKRKLWLCLLPVLCAACGPEVSLEAQDVEALPSEPIYYQGKATSTLSDAVCMPSALPPLSNVMLYPTELQTWPWETGKRFVGAGVASATVITIDSPDDPTKFIAYGFDVRGQKMLFHVHGDKAHYLEAFVLQVQRDFLALHASPGVASLEAEDGGSSSRIPTINTNLVDEVDPPYPTPRIEDPKLIRVLAHYQVAVRIETVSVKGKVQAGSINP